MKMVRSHGSIPNSKSQFRDMGPTQMCEAAGGSLYSGPRNRGVYGLGLNFESSCRVPIGPSILVSSTAQVLTFSSRKPLPPKDAVSKNGYSPDFDWRGVEEYKTAVAKNIRFMVRYMPA
jgi:hypothetical protein